MGVATVGYEGRSLDELLKVMRGDGATLLVDVRLTPVSRKVGLSKRRLSEALERSGIAYRHMPELGNPKDNRDSLRAGCPAAAGRFRDLLHEEPGRDALRELGVLSEQQRVMLLCYERDATTCHRSLVAEELSKMVPELEIRHVASE